MPELVFVSADAPAELAAALAVEVARQDAASLVLPAAPEPRGDRIPVFFDGAAVSTSQLPRAIAIVLAPPGSARFDAAVERTRAAGAVFHVNSTATERLLELGIPARHLQLGWSEAWQVESGPAEDRLAVIGGAGGYFDWVRALAALHAGRVPLQERGLGMAPMVAGRHLFVADRAAIDAVAAALRRDPDRLAAVVEEARRFVREALPLALAAGALVGAARALVAQPVAASGAGQVALAPR
jgi:hypothetical protein